MKMVMVKWVDSHEVQGWTPVDELGGYTAKEIKTIGFEIDRTDAGIVVAASFGTDPDQVCGTMMIPAVAITDVILLSENNEPTRSRGLTTLNQPTANKDNYDDR